MNKNQFPHVVRYSMVGYKGMKRESMHREQHIY